LELDVFGAMQHSFYWTIFYINLEHDQLLLISSIYLENSQVFKFRDEIYQFQAATRTFWEFFLLVSMLEP
jgi:hypothetical protein